MSRFHAFLPWSVMLSLVGPISGCKEDPPGKVVDENGTWSMVRYNTAGETEVLSEVQKDAFMMRFDSDASVVTMATCGMEMSGNTPGQSVCRQNHSMTGWACQCFSYAYHVDTMQMREFAAGDPPPPVDFVDPDEADGGGGGTGADTGGGGADSYTVVTENMTPPGTYAFSPLPEGVFGSDGQVDRFDFVRRADVIFDGPEPEHMNSPYEDPQAACTPCVPLD